MLALVTALLVVPEAPNLDLPPSAAGEIPPAREQRSEPDALSLADPDTRVVLRISERLGPLTDTLALELQLEASSARKIRDRLLQSELFALVPSARYRAVVRRLNRSTVELAMFDGEDQVGLAAIEWREGESEPTTKSRQSTLVIRAQTPKAIADAEKGTRGGFDPYFNPAGRLSWSRNGAFTQPSAPPTDGGWVILRDGSPIDDLDLALLLDDRALADRILSERASTRAWWRYGFGAAALSSAGAGAAFLATAEGRSSREVLGGSLLGLAALCGALVLFGDELRSDHVLSLEEANTLVRLYNDRETEKE